jgi:hypothetical protein
MPRLAGTIVSFLPEIGFAVVKSRLVGLSGCDAFQFSSTLVQKRLTRRSGTLECAGATAEVRFWTPYLTRLTN